ncbi:MAG: hypothetical protein ACRDNN_00635, partial [Gaiellaceae bacterium]
MFRDDSALPFRLVQEDADSLSSCVLDHVRQSLLDNTVENGFDLSRKPGIVQPRLELRLDTGVLGERRGQALDRGQ